MEWLDIHNSSTSTENCFSTVFNYSIAVTNPLLIPYSSLLIPLLTFLHQLSAGNGAQPIFKRQKCLSVATLDLRFEYIWQ